MEITTRSETPRGADKPSLNTLTMEQKRLQADARAFARDVLTKVGPATRGLPTPLARFAATRPFYEQAVAAGFLRRLIPAPLGGEGTAGLDMAVRARGVHAAGANRLPPLPAPR